MNVHNIVSDKGNTIPNQFVITTSKGKYFQSYKSVIAFVPKKGKIQLDEKYWNYSTTTGKYRNIFLGEKKKETQLKIDLGMYILANLNQDVK